MNEWENVINLEVELDTSLHLHMESVCLELSGRRLGDAAALAERDFIFCVGGVEYQCCRFQACFVSGLVRRLLASDCCPSCVSLKVSDDKGHFKDIVSLMNGQKISITPVNAEFLEECARELENDELVQAIITSKLDIEGVSMSNVVDHIRVKSGFHGDCKDELDFVASHFFEADLGVLKCLSLSDLERVLANPLLKLESEDQLYDVILSLARENREDVLVLLRYIQFAFLSESKLDEFLDWIFPNHVNASIWTSLCECVRRFCGSSAKFPLMNMGRYRIEMFTSEQGPFNGILRHIQEECGGNPHEKGVMSITASGNSYNRCHQVVNNGWQDWWCSGNKANSFVQFDFKSRHVSLNQYSLRSDNNDAGHLLSWVLEVSDDGATWETIDERDTQDMNQNNVVRTYKCEVRSCRVARIVRLRQTGKNGSNDDALRLAQIEFFGQLTK